MVLLARFGQICASPARAIGYLITGLYATTQGWPTAVPLWTVTGGVAATLVIGAVAGLYPAVRAARLAPTEALAGG
jgi:putative ABC transport system permease protein